MIFLDIGIAGDAPCGWAYQPRRDRDQPGKPVIGSVQDTQNRTLLHAANKVLESLGKAKPMHCGATGVDGVNVLIRASQLYLVNAMTGKDNGRANRDLLDILQETARQRSLEGFVIQWQHIPAEDNPMREVAARAATDCIPILLDSPNSFADANKPAPWEDV